MLINGLEWKIVYSDNMKDDLFGQTNYDTLTIYLRKQCTKQTLARTLMHEIVHAYCYSIGLLFFETYDREQLCEFISHNIFNLTDLFNNACDELRKEQEK